MNSPKILFALLAIFTANTLYAGNPIKVGQFINHKDWSFVENKGQLAPCPLKGDNKAALAPDGKSALTLKGTVGIAPTLKGVDRESDIKYYSHEGGANIYCRPGKISFVFTKIEKSDDQVSEATGTSVLSPAGGGRGWKNNRNTINHPTKTTTNRLDLILLNSNLSALITPSDQQEYYENYYTTGDANHGITNAHTYKTITYKNIYPHIDMVLHACPNSTAGRAKETGLKYEFVVYPGGKVSDIQLQWNGLDRIKKLENSNIKYTFPLGNMTETAPYTYTANVGAGFTPAQYTDVNGPKIESRFILKNNHISFKTGRYDKRKVLVIDPVLEWATYFGGSWFDAGQAVCTDKNGNVYMTGWTESSNIATNGAFQTNNAGGSNGGGDAFIAKFSNSGNLLWTTYYGGAGDDFGQAICADLFGNVYIVGQTTSSTGMASSAAYQTSYLGNTDAFFAKFSSSGNLFWGTYYGGNNEDYGYGIGADQLGNIYITGMTNSIIGIATSGAYQTSFAGNSDAFLAKFNTTGNRLWATFYGGSGGDCAFGISVDVFGNVYISGVTMSSSDIATSGAYQSIGGVGSNAFLAKFTSSGSIIWGTYYGSLRGGCSGGSVSTDPFGNVYITGGTVVNSGIATFGAYQTSFGGNTDAFLAKFNKSGGLLWATYYGGSGSDWGRAISTDASGSVYIVGETTSYNNISTADAYQTYNSGIYDAFLAKFSSSGGLSWATFYGGNADDRGHGVCTDVSGNIFITGFTESSNNVASKGAFQASESGDYDAFLAKFGVLNNTDAGIASISLPRDSFCPGVEAIKLELKNFGGNELDSVKINWSINRKVQNLINWTGKLSHDSSISVSLGNYNFLSGTDTIKAWTTKPNGQTDSFPQNDTSKVVVFVYALPPATAGPDTTLCYNETYTMQGAGGITYLWTPAKYLDNDSIAHPKANLPNTQLYTLIVRNKYGCSDSAQVLLTVKPRTIAAFSQLSLKPYQLDSALYFHSLSQNASGYLWDFGDKSTSNAIDPDHIFTSTGTFKIILVAYNSQGCSNDTTISYIHISSKNIKIFIPNAFTPNTDNVNDIFDIKGIGIVKYTYNIYNRWGEHIFRSSESPAGDPDGKWDGKYKGETVPDGVYLYQLDVTDIDGEHHYLNGTVTVIR